MSPNEFCYWLKGYFEITYISDLNRDQVQVIKDHLDLVFNKVTPDRPVKDYNDILYKKLCAAQINLPEVYPQCMYSSDIPASC